VATLGLLDQQYNHIEVYKFEGESNSPSGQTHQSHQPWSGTTATSSLPPDPVAMAPQRWERWYERRHSNTRGG